MNAKFEYLTDVLDRYSMMVNDGIKLSIDQKCQVFDTMIELNRMSIEQSVKNKWIALAKDLIKETI